MEIVPIDLSKLNTDAFEAYMNKADGRIRCGARTVLEALSIPLPPVLTRRPSGPKPGQAIAAAIRRHDERQANGEANAAQLAAAQRRMIRTNSAFGG